MSDLFITRGDDEDLAITVVDENRAPVDISGSVIFITMKIDPSLVDDDASLRHDTLVGADEGTVAGKTTITLPRAKTSTLEALEYYTDVQIVLGGKVKTIFNGTIEVMADITRRDAAEV